MTRGYLCSGCFSPCGGTQMMRYFVPTYINWISDSLFRCIAVGTAIKMTTTASPKTPRSTLAMGTCLGASEETVRQPLRDERLVEHHPKIPWMGKCQQAATNHCFARKWSVDPISVQITTSSIQHWSYAKRRLLLLNIIPAEVSKVEQ